jgi:omega-amidase
MKKLKIALAQITIHYANPKENLEKAHRMISEASLAGCDLILLPELWSSGYDLEKAQHYSQVNAGLLKELQNTADQRGITIGGTLIEEEQGKLYNVFSLLVPGMSRTTYRKIHLFPLIDEHITFEAGEQLAITSWKETTIGLATCYDLRFPELFRRMAVDGMQLLLLSAEWPLVRAHHWQILVQARAIENQVFIAAVNCVGETDGIAYGGNSMIVSPWGEVLAHGNHKNEQLLTAEIDLDQVSEARDMIPVFQDRRPDLYE